MEIVTEDYILWVQQQGSGLGLTAIELTDVSQYCKYSTKLDVQKTSIFGSFGESKSLLDLLRSPLNYSFDFKQRTFTLQWKISSSFFKKLFNFKLDLQKHQLTEKEMLEYQIIMLKRKIAVFEQKQKRGKQEKQEDMPQKIYPQIIRVDSEEKFCEKEDKQNKVAQTFSSCQQISSPILKKRISKRIKRKNTENCEEGIEGIDRKNQQKKVISRRLQSKSTRSSERKKQNQQIVQKVEQKQLNNKKECQQKSTKKKRGRKCKKDLEDIKISAQQQQKVMDPVVKSNQNKLIESPTSVKSKINSIIESNRTQHDNTNLAIQYRNCKATQKLGDKIRLDFENGDYYFGQTKDHLYQGFGLYYSVENGTYEGEWKKGKGTGYGVSVDNEGNRHEGMYENDLKNGQGTEVFANGQKYVGNFKDSSRDGYGVYHFEDGGIYEGDWKDDLQDGYGKFTSSNGTIYEGYWKKDEKDGPGVLHSPFGKINQVWQMGTLISPGFVKIQEPIDE